MNADRIQIQEGPSRVFQNRKGESTQLMEDNRVQSALQAKMVETMQRDAMDEDDLLQGKFAVQRDVEDEDELLQGKFVAQRQTKNQTGIPDHVIQGMESSFGTDFSSVRVHPDSSKAPDTYKPDTSAGQQLLGHELTHVIQQAEGRVQPTTEVGGMAVNDDLSLEHEADVMGAKAASVL